MPCLNEEETVGICIWKARTFMQEYGITGEVIIADNGSTDNSVQISNKMGARVVHVKEKGYGYALTAGIQSAKGKYIIMADSDDSYDFLDLKGFVDNLRNGNDLVMGNRFKGKIHTHAMPWHHKYIGNPVLSFTGRLFFDSKVGDFHCGLRGFTKEAFKRMDIRTTGMEFASEIVVKASMQKMKIKEIPIQLYPDGRTGSPHLQSFNDGWRHLRFLLMFSPRWLFFYPGLLMILLGSIASLYILFNPDSHWDIHTMLYSSGVAIIGVQAIIFSIFSRIFALHEGLIPESPKISRYIEKLSLEKALIYGILLILAGILIFFYSFFIWQEGTFYELGIRITLRYVIISVFLIVVGFQIIFSGFFINILMLRTRS
jgi:glycosyltransferase involved in cell wall biosynthesis